MTMTDPEEDWLNPAWPYEAQLYGDPLAIVRAAAQRLGDRWVFGLHGTLNGGVLRTDDREGLQELQAQFPPPEL